MCSQSLTRNGFAAGNVLVHVLVRASALDQGFVKQVSSTAAVSRNADPDGSLRLLYALTCRAGKPTIACSASGRCVSVVWPDIREYAIYIASPTEARP